MFDLGAYSEPVAAILGPAEGGTRRMPLAPRGPLEGDELDRLRRTPAEDLLEGPCAAPEFAACLRSALFLYFSALDESHKLSQDIASPAGSWLHGIMHRQEPDYSNAKYWFRRVGSHELFPTLREEALGLRLVSTEARTAVERSPKWDALGFVDLCERGAREGGDLAEDLVSIQRMEWQLLFDYCYRRALAG